MTPTDLQMEYDLSPSLAKLMLLLIENKVVTANMIEHDFKIATDAKIAIHRLRRRLIPSGIEILSRRDVGYWLPISVKEAIEKRVFKQMTLPLDHSGKPEDSSNTELQAA